MHLVPGFDFDAFDQPGNDQMLGTDVRRFKALCLGEQFVDLGFGRFGVFFFCFHSCLGVFHCPLGRFKLGAVFDQHGIDNAQIKLAIACQCLDCFFLQGSHLLLCVLKIFLSLCEGDPVCFLVSGAGKFYQAFAGHGLDLVVMIGNNMRAAAMQEELLQLSSSPKEILFAFQVTGGERLIMWKES